MTTLHSKKSIGRSPLRRGLLLIPLAFVCFALTPASQAVNPAPDGGYTGGNTAEGADALLNLDVTLGIQNTGIGRQALLTNVSGGNNTAVGFQALRANTATNNTATGFQALINNTGGINNIAVGGLTLTHITTPSNNTAVGWKALQVSNPLGGDPSTAVGSLALLNNTTGEDNDALGFKALQSNTDGFFNNAFGHEALNKNVHGSQNNAFGDDALFKTTGSFNTAFGDDAGFEITTGESNVCLGDEAGPDLGGTGSGNVLIGAGAGDGVTSGDNIVCIGAGCSSDNFSDRAFIPNVAAFAQATSGTVDFVTVRLADGKLGHVASSRRYKEDIKPMDNASELLYQLKPVTFRFKKDVENPSRNLDYGLIAEDVAEINPELAVRDGKGQIESVRYMAIYNMMLNEFLKEHRKVQGLEATVAQQQKGMEVLTAQVKEQAAQIQNVSAQIEVNKRAPRTVANK